MTNLQPRAGTLPPRSLLSQHTYLTYSGTQEIRGGYHIGQFDTELPKNSKRIRTLNKEIFPITVIVISSIYHMLGTAYDLGLFHLIFKTILIGLV
jgi:hypothetical protein